VTNNSPLCAQQGTIADGAAPRIKTTVVGSIRYRTGGSALGVALIDATRVAIHTQEQAGIDLVCDGNFHASMSIIPKPTG
jgi:hypothetical protein